MALEVIQLENQLMKSNCFILVDWVSKSCVIIDPASEKSEQEIEFIEKYSLHLDYIMLTHEHTDHTWGVNALKEKYPESKILCSEACNKYAPKASRAYFLLYFDNPNYRYVIKPADVIIRKQEEFLDWHGYRFNFVITPGHSYGSMCIGIGNILFTGDTVMPFSPHLNKRDSNREDWKNSIKLIEKKYLQDMEVYPGHGEKLSLDLWLQNPNYSSI